MSSYQRRKRDVEFYAQCVTELEAMCKQLAAQLKDAGIAPAVVGLGSGITGNSFLTPYNTGEFAMRLL